MSVRVRTGSCIVECKGYKIGVIHVAGQVFMRYHFASPFIAVDEEMEKMKVIVREYMENAVNLSVPLKVEMGTGQNWYDLK